MDKQKRREMGRINDYKYLRELNSRWYSEQTKFSKPLKRFIKQRVLPCISFSGYKLKAKEEIAVNIIALLWLAEKRTMTIKDYRDNSKNTLRIGVWDALEQAGLVYRHTGSKMSGHVTRYRCSRTLKSIMQGYSSNKPLIDYNLHRNTSRKKPTKHALIVLQTSKRDIKTGKLRPTHERGKPMPLNDYPAGVVRYLEELENKLESIARNALKHKYYPDINPCVRYIYSEVLGRYGMLHSWSILSFQSFSKEEREAITIDGEPTVELDFSGYLLRQYYHYRKIEPTRGDIYQPERIIPNYDTYSPEHRKLMRNLVKKATLLCMNNGDFWKVECFPKTVPVKVRV